VFKPTLPHDAFAYYLAAGKKRSLRKIALQFGVSRSTVARRAKLERWRERIAELDADSDDPEQPRQRAIFDIEIARFAGILRDDPERAAAELGAMPLTSAMEAIQVLFCAIMAERKTVGARWDIYSEGGR